MNEAILAPDGQNSPLKATCENHTYIARRPLRNDRKSLQHVIPDEETQIPGF